MTITTIITTLQSIADGKLNVKQMRSFADECGLTIKGRSAEEVTRHLINGLAPIIKRDCDKNGTPFPRDLFSKLVKQTEPQANAEEQTPSASKAEKPKASRSAKADQRKQEKRAAIIANSPAKACRWDMEREHQGDRFCVEIACIDCGAKRYIKPSDVFQVARCKACAEKAFKANRAEKMRNRRAAKAGTSPRRAAKRAAQKQPKNKKR